MELVVSGVDELSVTNVQYHVFEVGLTELNVALPLVNEDSVCTRVDPVLQVEVVEEYRLAVYVDVPPLHENDKIMLWPKSIVGFDADI